MAKSKKQKKARTVNLHRQQAAAKRQAKGPKRVLTGDPQHLTPTKLIVGFKSDALSIVKFREELRAKLQVRLDLAVKLNTEQPSDKHQKIVDGWREIFNHFATFDQQVNDVAAITGKLEDLKDNESRMRYIAETFHIVTQSQVQLAEIAEEISHLESRQRAEVTSTDLHTDDESQVTFEPEAAPVATQETTDTPSA